MDRTDFNISAEAEFKRLEKEYGGLESLVSLLVNNPEASYAVSSGIRFRSKNYN